MVRTHAPPARSSKPPPEHQLASPHCHKMPESHAPISSRSSRALDPAHAEPQPGDARTGYSLLKAKVTARSPTLYKCRGERGRVGCAHCDSRSDDLREPMGGRRKLRPHGGMAGAVPDGLMSLRAIASRAAKHSAQSIGRRGRTRSAQTR